MTGESRKLLTRMGSNLRSVIPSAGEVSKDMSGLLFLFSLPFHGRFTPSINAQFFLLPLHFLLLVLPAKRHLFYLQFLPRQL
jgi:hypothetical protein